MFGLMSGLYESYLAPKQISILMIGCDESGKTALLERCKVTQFCSKREFRNLHKSILESTESTDELLEKSTEGRSRRSFCNSIVFVDEVENGEDDTTGTLYDHRTYNYLRLKRQRNDGNDSIDLIPGAKIFPLHKIKPTGGMNLAKLNACGCKCVIWDLGGRVLMRPLWERYFDECDGVIFVVDSTFNSDRMEESCRLFLSVFRNELLNQVPILVFFNKLDISNYDNCHIFLQFLKKHQVPNDFLTFSGGSAKTGEGVRHAIEYLILSITLQNCNSTRLQVNLNTQNLNTSDQI